MQPPSLMQLSTKLMLQTPPADPMHPPSLMQFSTNLALLLRTSTGTGMRRTAMRATEPAYSSMLEDTHEAALVSWG